jgi:tRNA-2-methylthio-N6-dimethylallyladenosine synthase
MRWAAKSVVRMQKRVFIETYGCQMNEADSEVMAGVLAGGGFSLAEMPADADVILVNTCSVRGSAEDRVFGRLAELSKIKLTRPGVLLGVCGCMSKRLGNRILERAPYVDLLAGPDSYRRLPDLIRAASAEPALDLRLEASEDYTGLDPVRAKGVGAWVTVMRGCDKFCAFCVVPFVRGRERSVPSGEVMRQVRGLAGEGFKEVTLLGQTVNSYRWNGEDFAELLRMVASVPGILRVRFTAPHPVDFSDGLIEAMTYVEAVCPHVHLPLQSGSDAVLEHMRRGYTSSEYLELVGRLRNAIPGVAITTDILVGFPGETEDDHRATCDMMREVRFDSAFTFRYSPREGTYAFRKLADDVSDEDKRRRLSEVIELQETISREVNASAVGCEVEVLVEGRSKRREGQLFGRTATFKTTVFADDGSPAGAMVRVAVEDATSHTLLGRAVSGRPARRCEERDVQHGGRK